MKKFKHLLLIVMFCSCVQGQATEQSMSAGYILKFWDYGNPALSEERFQEILPQFQNGNNGLLAVLKTQIARTYSLRHQFERAQLKLNEARQLIAEENSEAMVFYLLELGRTFNSSGDKERALPLFVKAWETARLIENDYLAVDAAHMVAIAEEIENQLKWNMKALLLAEASASENANNWLGSLYNNIGWTYFNQERFTEALEMFEKAVEFRKYKGDRNRLWIAQWTLGKTRRAMGHLATAIAIQQQIEKEQLLAGVSPDPYVYEELAELYLMRDDSRASAYFDLAYKGLSADPWIQKNEPQRLTRLKEMGSLKGKMTP